MSSFENRGFYTFNVDLGLLTFYRFAEKKKKKKKKTKRIAKRSELQNLDFKPADGLLQISGRVNEVPSSGKFLCRVDVSDSRVFASYIIRLLSFSTES